MTTVLVPGQNAPWPHADLQVLAPGVELVVLALGADDRVLDPSAVLRAVGGVRLHLPAVPDEAQRLLVLGLGPWAGSGAARAVDVVVADAEGGAVASVTCGETGTVALLEVYRRSGAWKVRAVVRAYAAGAGDVERLHGARLAEAASPPAGAAPAAHGAPPVGHDRAVQLVGMVLEDAARSGASYVSSVAYADSALEAEESAIVADPALRVSVEGDRARAAAQARRDDLVARARRAHLDDLATLRAEVVDIERSLPPAMRRWDALRAADQHADTAGDPPTVLRAGDITLAHLEDVPGADFRLPMVWRTPSRPLLVTVDETDDATATRVAVVLALRAAAALARHQPRVVVTDLGGHRGDLGLPPGLTAAPVTSPAVATRLLVDLDRRSDLVEVARANGALDALDVEMLRPVVLVLTDVPTAWEAEALPLLDRLVSRSAPGLQVVMTGPDRPPRIGSAAEDRLLEAVWSSSLRLPSGPGGRLADAFAGVAWTFLPDTGPSGAPGAPGRGASDDAVLGDGLRALLGAVAPLDGWRDGIVPSPG